MGNFIKYASFIIVLIGALNWGLVGTFQFDLVSYLFGEMSLLTRCVYILVGICAIISAITAYNCRRTHHDDL